MAKLRAGDKVIVRFNENDQFNHKPVQQYNGQEFTIRRVREIVYGTSGALRGTEYYLDGVVSPYGIPYAFLEEHLVRL